jgi:hypothetical protein
MSINSISAPCAASGIRAHNATLYATQSSFDVRPITGAVYAAFGQLIFVLDRCTWKLATATSQLIESTIASGIAVNIPMVPGNFPVAWRTIYSDWPHFL